MRDRSLHAKMSGYRKGGGSHDVLNNDMREGPYMAHTDKEDDWHRWRRHWLSDECTYSAAHYWSRGFHYRLPQSCEICDLAPWPYGRVLGPIENPQWRQDCRREERANGRHLMTKARKGRIDWDDLTIGYRRPYYW